MFTSQVNKAHVDVDAGGKGGMGLRSFRMFDSFACLVKNAVKVVSVSGNTFKKFKEAFCAFIFISV